MEPALRHFITAFGPLAPLGLVLALVLQQLFPLVPSSLLIGLGGALFGPFWGFCFSWIGVVASSAVCYHLGRKGGDWTERLLKGRHSLLHRIEERLRYPAIGVLFLRAIPLFPFNLVSVLSGVLRVRFLPYLGATMLGIVPGLWLYVFLGNGLAGVLQAWLKTYFLRM